MSSLSLLLLYFILRSYISSYIYIARAHYENLKSTYRTTPSTNYIATNCCRTKIIFKISNIDNNNNI